MQSPRLRAEAELFFHLHRNVPTMTTADRPQYMQAFRQRQRHAGVRRVNITLTKAEYEQMSQSAMAHGERITTHLKACAFAQLSSRYLVPPDLAERLDALVAILRGVGNNLNQLARHSNEMRYFLDTEQVRLQLKRIDEEVRRFVGEPPRAND